MACIIQYKNTYMGAITMNQKALFQKALSLAGYNLPPTAESIKQCLLDYIDAGVFVNVEPEDLEDMTPEEMARGIINYCR
jgi:hypothetical protein